MAFQCKQPCLPPPSEPPCPAACASYQAKQPCAPPPTCASAAAPSDAPTPDAPCAAAPTVELRASPWAAPARPFAFVAEDAAAAAAAAPAYPGPAAEDCPAPRAQPALSYVMPGSTVRLNPSGALSVEPGAPADAGSVFVEAYSPHFL